MKTVSAYLNVSDSRAALEFYATVFGATEIGPTITMADGGIAHTETQIGASVVMLADSSEEWGNKCPKTLGGTPVSLNVVMEDVDATIATAVENGAEILIPVADQFYGIRQGRIRDPFGHEWVVSKLIEEVSEEEMQRRCDELFGGGGES
jgi:PhnB protein